MENGQENTQQLSEPVNITETDILKDFGENIPDDYVPVYTSVPKDQLLSISNEGLDPEFRAKRLPQRAKDLDDRIKNEAEAIGKVDLDRLNSNYAYPEDPNVKLLTEYYGNPDEIILEMRVDPKSWVCDSGLYGKISELDSLIAIDPEHQTEGWVKTLNTNVLDYINSAVSLKEYLEEQYLQESISQAEVLVNGIIEPKFIRISPSKSANRQREIE